MKTIIHINMHNIRHNSKCLPAERKPVVTSKTYKENTYCDELDIVDDNGNIIATLTYSPDKPLSCGAKVWIEADSKNVRIK